MPKQTLQSQHITAQTLRKDIFSDFGDIIEKAGAAQHSINNGNCIRYHDLAHIELTGPAARPLINIFAAKPYTLPLQLTLVERHPLGSQAFIPLSANPFLVIVCRDNNGRPNAPQAFVTARGQGINLKRNVWHGVLTPLYQPAEFIVIDRGGDGDNLEEFTFDEPYIIGL